MEEAMGHTVHRIKGFLLHDVLKAAPGFGKKTAAITLIEIVTGLFLSFLIEVNLGTDPATFMNVSISAYIGISFGSWQLLFNLALLSIVVALSRFRYLGVGTVANMILIGYSADFFRWLWRNILPDGFFLTEPVRVIFFIAALIGFIVFSALYMNYSMGLSPYDAVPCIVRDRLEKVPFTIIRMCWDFGIIGIGCLFGGHPPVGSLILAVSLGPVISLTGKWMRCLH